MRTVHRSEGGRPGGRAAPRKVGSNGVNASGRAARYRVGSSGVGTGGRAAAFRVGEEEMGRGGMLGRGGALQWVSSDRLSSAKRGVRVLAGGGTVNSVGGNGLGAESGLKIISPLRAPAPSRAGARQRSSLGIAVFGGVPHWVGGYRVGGGKSLLSIV
jgi:hypothetical protein